MEMIIDRIDGKATQNVDLSGDVSTEKKGLGIDISKLSTEEKEQMEKILEKVDAESE